MNYLQLETSREMRMWLKQIIIPAVTTVMILAKTQEGQDLLKLGGKKLKSLFKKVSG